MRNKIDYVLYLYRLSMRFLSDINSNAISIHNECDSGRVIVSMELSTRLNVTNQQIETMNLYLEKKKKNKTLLHCNISNELRIMRISF